MTLFKYVLKRFARPMAISVFLLAMSATAFTQTATNGVFTYHNDLARTGQNLNETFLTPTNVNSTNFGKKFSDTVDGLLYAQPLYIANVAIPGQGTHNVVYVATENDTVYAFDADTAGAPLWQTSLLVNGGTAVPSSDVNCSDLVPEIGVTATPVIDPTTRTLYVVAKTKEGPSTSPSYFQRLHALDTTTGAEKFGGPIVITATASGAGAGGNGTSITFDPLMHLNRAGLALVNGVVYIGFGSHCDNYPYHGWVLAYQASQLTQVGVFVTTPNSYSAGVWQSGDSLAVDASNDLYVMTGNGPFNANQGGMDFGDSFLKLSQNGNTLALADYFTPFNQATMGSNDTDLGSGGTVVLPDQTGTQFPHLLIGAGKEGTIYLLNRDNLGQYCNGCSSDTQIVQSIPGALGRNFDTPAFWNNTVYFLASNDVLKAFSLTNGTLSAAPTSQGSTSFGFSGATPSVSANGSTSGIVWALETDAFATSGPAVLHAYDANNVANELYNSNQAAGGRDTLGPAVKFTVPTVINGQVYVGTANELDVLGLLGAASPAFSPGGGTYTGPVTVTISDATSGATIYYTTDGSTPTTSSAVYTGALTFTQTTTLQAMAAASSMANSAVANATYTIQQQQQVATPAFNPGGGTYTGSVAVTISDATNGATIYYTTDGSTPTTSSAVYTGALTFTQTTTLQAMAAAGGMTNSAVASATYTIQQQVATPAFSPGGGTYTGSVTVTISDAISGATIYYTTDGSTPTTSSAVYTGALTFTQTTTLQAMAAAGGMTNSAVASATYTKTLLNLTVSKAGLGGGTVTSSPAGINCGSNCSALYASGTAVTLTATPGTLSGFGGWTGCDSVSGNICIVNMNSARSVTADFKLLGAF